MSAAPLDYPPPLDRLLSYGDCRDLPEWPNYLALGLSARHVPDLIRMALDEELHQSDEGVAMWAPVHAWRALGQLRAVEATAPLTALFRRIDEDGDDWVAEQLPIVYGQIGEPGIAALGAFLADSSHSLCAHIAAAESLLEIGKQQPRARDAVVETLSRRLERFVENNVGLNGWLIADLTALKAVESAHLMEQAFAFNRVDVMVTGDWEDVQVTLGLKAGRDRPRETSNWDQLMAETAPQPAARAPAGEKQKQKTKAKRKQVKQSRKKNRRR